MNSLTKPEKIVLEEDTATDTFGRFIVEPLEKGYGQTLGNSMRRTLLSTLDGYAITWIKIDGVDHEFSTMKDIVEDVIEIVLNFKKVRIFAHEKGERVLELKANKKGEVTAAHIISDGTIEVLNPEQKICTLNKDREFRVEFLIKQGRGFSPASANKPEDTVIGVIPIDAEFSPIVKVLYSVSDTRVGQNTDYDKLVLEVYTDGRTTPQDAVEKASIVLCDFFNLFNISGKRSSGYPPLSSPEEADMLRIMLTNVKSLDLSVRAENCLELAQIKYLGQLIQKADSEMLKFRNFGKKSLQEIKDKMEANQLSFGMSIPEEVRTLFEKRIADQEGQ